MHPALQVDEILLNIFSHWDPHYYDLSDPPIQWELLERFDLAALARTCHIFKEPALNVLWSVLADLSPVARCLPQFSYPIYRGSIMMYGFHRCLEQAEWHTLQSYTRRIRSIYNFDTLFYSHKVETFLRPSTSDPLFPNLRHLRYLYYGNDPSKLLHQPLPSLISVTYAFKKDDVNLSQFKDYLAVFPGDSPKLGQLTIDMYDPEVTIDPVVSYYICRWPNPRIVSCPLITLDFDAFKHLSYVSHLTQLHFTLDATLPDRITPFGTLFFNRLQQLKLRSKSLIPVSKLLACIQLPAITDLTVTFEDVPTKQNVASFLEVLRASGICNSITTLTLLELDIFARSPGSDDVVVGNDLRPLMALKKLHRLDFNLNWNVGLADDDLLELASAWPHLEHLLINQSWGWRLNSGGITPDGIIRLLQTCRSLSELALAVDTRNFVEASLGLNFKLPRSLTIDIVDSTIEPASVPAMVTFLTHLTHLLPSGTLSLKALKYPNWRDKDQSQRRRDVIMQARKAAQHGRIRSDLWFYM